MGNKVWIWILAGVLAVCAGLSVWLLLPGQEATHAEIWSDGQLIETVRLDTDRSLTVESRYGTNTVTVKDGKIAVTQADCPDHYCMQRGYCNAGAQIVCLPNRLVIKFVGQQELDGVTG